MGRFIIFAAVALAVGVLTARSVDRSGATKSPSSALAAGQAESLPSSPLWHTVTLSPAKDGHFWTEARVDGRRLELVVDTGASQISL